MAKGYLLVEGHGEIEAALNLVARTSTHLNMPVVWARAIRWKNLHQRAGVENGANYIRSRGDASALLVLRDEDDGCPKTLGPETAHWLRALNLPFCSAVVLLRPEFEVLFLPCIDELAGRTLSGPRGARAGLRLGTRWNGGWESRRGIKEWLTANFSGQTSYKPTTDQLQFTRMLDIPKLAAAAVPCFDTLQRAVTFLGSGSSGTVYP